MHKKRIQIKNCLLGYGYASLIAYQKILEKNDPKDILILRNEKSKQIITLEHQGKPFSPLPIFPVLESELYNSNLFDDIPTQNNVTVSFSELANFDVNEYNLQHESLASFMISKQGIDRGLCLAFKQWGSSMAYKPFGQVQSKIKRHYISKQGNTRIGYINGLSLFKYAVDKLNPEVVNYANLEKIDIKKREIHLTDCVVVYEKLISTIPLHKFFKYCNLEHDHISESAGAYFKFFSYTKGLEQNQMLYDCDYNSDILRLFSITDTFLMAQLRSDTYPDLSTSEVKRRIQELVPDIEGLEFAKELFTPMSYPLELVDEPNSMKNLLKLKENGITTLGRFGNWEYSDLHELDWSVVD